MARCHSVIAERDLGPVEDVDPAEIRFVTEFPKGVSSSHGCAAYVA